MKCGALVLASFLTQTASVDQCTTGITFDGHGDTRFNGDYLLQWLYPAQDPEAGKRFGGPTVSTHEPFPIQSIGRYTISPGCLGLPVDHCIDFDRQRSQGKWILYSTTTDQVGSHVPGSCDGCPSNTVVAICTTGCPPAISTKAAGRESPSISVWPSDTIETTWELTGELGGQGTLNVTTSCCTRKHQECDGYAKCPSHNTFGGIWSLSCHQDPCCIWTWPADIAVGGHCVPDPTKIETQCDHGSEAASLLV